MEDTASGEEESVRPYRGVGIYSGSVSLWVLPSTPFPLLGSSLWGSG